MGKYYYDLHIHSCLSPCGDTDMTPANIAGMAAVAGLDCPPLFTPMICGYPQGMVVTVPLWLDQLNGEQSVDTLGKGASGAAVQNMNLMLGFEETAGLSL